ncbi:MAG: beta-ketoacyl-[acyl-carrier-protein] synthase II [Flammeovirgaceae bacterium]|nr:beta-ketoacyl-[acyl-carrier-protein] synthase II [Flammeovirgaceae bacterium]HCX21832.1 beta-ketoacyl-[acyl-carrier-protein] synthase II [Cytophagales bacterium]|tara:strand:- start:3224 stop:4477 length:1254 start_codon:yes stop_codon:yes gene_type:complete
MELKRVVVTGIGAVTPLGNNKNDYWNALAKGVSGAAPITRFDTEKFRTKFACEVKDFNVLDFIDRKEARKMDLNSHYGMVASDEAITDAGLDLEKVNKDRIGVIWGSGIGGFTTFQEEVVGFANGDGTPRFNPFFVPKMILDITPGLISIKYGFRGPNFATVSACASSNNALSDAFNYIRLGKANAIITGGSEASVIESGIGGFNALKALSERNDDPTTASRPYDKDRDGFVLGEGSGAMVLEELEHAKARGAKIYAEVLGAGMSADAYHITAPHPEGEGIVIVLNEAISDAQIKVEDIDYINTHGTSTPLGDSGEVKAIQKVLGEHAYNINISSTKSMTGHLLGAAGAIESIATLMTIDQGIIPPTINHFTDDPEIDPKLNLTFNEAQKRDVNVAISNTFGFGGHNTSIVFGKYNG